MRICVIGCGRWGSLITWYLDSIGHEVTLYGRADSQRMRRFLETRENDLLRLPESVALTTELSAVKEAETVIISVNSQGLQALMDELRPLELKDKTFVLCMKGIEIGTGRRLSQIATENLDASNHVAVWLGPGHVQEFYRGIPNCMVIDSQDAATKERLIPAEVCRALRAMMAGCGLYDSTGRYNIEVGIPAKSGSSGVIMAAALGRAGLAAFSPKQDGKGNSVCGMKALAYLSREMNLRVL